jgi:hypothetical protein
MTDKLGCDRPEFQIEFVKNEHDHLEKELDLLKSQICSFYILLWKRKLLTKSLSIWRSLLSFTCSLERKAKMVILRLEHSAALISFRAWDYQLQEQRRVAIVETRIIRRWRHGVLSLSFQTWADRLSLKRRFAKFKHKAVKPILADFLQAWNTISRYSRYISRNANRTILQWLKNSPLNNFL